MRYSRIAAVVAITVACAACGKKEAPPEVSPNGFIKVMMPEESQDNVVMVFAPENCPSDASQRAHSMRQALINANIPVVMSSSYSLTTRDNSDKGRYKLNSTRSVMEGELPAVLINGMGRANPTASQVIAEYKRTRGN